MSEHVLAQINVARARAPLHDPLMRGFVAQIDGINALAEATPGFVWRLAAEGGGGSSYLDTGDPHLLVNLTVWESLEALHAFVYRSDHVELIRARREWFAMPTGPVVALWWVRRGETPSLEDGLERLRHLQEHGPSPHAFTFRQVFDPPAARPLIAETG